MVLSTRQGRRQGRCATDFLAPAPSAFYALGKEFDHFATNGSGHFVRRFRAGNQHIARTLRSQAPKGDPLPAHFLEGQFRFARNDLLRFGIKNQRQVGARQEPAQNPRQPVCPAESVALRVDQHVVKIPAKNNKLIPYFGGQDLDEIAGQLVAKIVKEFCPPGEVSPGCITVRVGYWPGIVARFEHSRPEMEQELAAEKRLLDQWTDVLQQGRFADAVRPEHGQVQPRRSANALAGTESFPCSIPPAETVSSQQPWAKCLPLRRQLAEPFPKRA